MLYAEAKAAGYTCGYTRATDSVRAWRQGERQSVSARTPVALGFDLGEEFNFDGRAEGLAAGGVC
jgi:hypothetical protein